MILDASERTFLPFSLTRLLTTCFGAGDGERVCILIDLPNPADIEDFKFLEDETLSIQNYGYETFYKGFKAGGLDAMNWAGGEIYAYKETGGSNLDMADECYDVQRRASYPRGGRGRERGRSRLGAVRIRRQHDRRPGCLHRPGRPGSPTARPGDRSIL